MGVSVVIRTYTEERWHFFENAVRSVMEQNHRPEEIIIVVDHNESLETKVRNSFPKVTVVPSEKRGSSGAWNTGIFTATQEIIAFIDDDAIAEPTWLQNLLARYSNPDVLGVEGQIIPIWHGGKPTWFPEEMQWIVGCSYRGLPEKVGEVRNLIGCNMSFRRDALYQAEGFTETPGLGHMGKAPVGCDETELSIRIRQQNPDGMLLHDSNAVVHHNVPDTRSTWSYFLERCRHEGRSKAIVSELVGTKDGLSSELTYTLVTLPTGVLKGFADVLIGDLNGARRGFAIMAALFTTTLYYLMGRLKKQQPAPSIPTSVNFSPTQIVDIDISQPLPYIQSSVNGLTYTRAQLHIRYHHEFCGVMTLDIPENGLHAGEYMDNLLDNVNFRNEALLDVTQTTIHQPFVSVIICTRDRTTDLSKCLPSILAQDYSNYEVVVVDNAPSTHDTYDLLMSYKTNYPNLRYICEAQVGLSNARNRGMIEATGEILAFTDDDAIADRGWVSRIAANFCSDPTIACVTGYTLPAELETPAQYWFEQFGGFNKGRELQWQSFSLNTHKDEPLFPYLSAKFGAGVNMAFRADVLKSVGGFDIALGAGTCTGGAEDIDAYFRVIMDGHTLVYDPQAVVKHFHRRDYEGLKHQLGNNGKAFGAFVMKTLLDNPLRFVYLLQHIPYAVHYLFMDDSPRNEHKTTDYPQDLSKGELMGMVQGPFLYLKSQVQVRF